MIAQIDEKPILEDELEGSALAGDSELDQRYTNLGDIISNPNEAEAPSNTIIHEEQERAPTERTSKIIQLSPSAYRDIQEANQVMKERGLTQTIHYYELKEMLQEDPETYLNATRHLLEQALNTLRNNSEFVNASKARGPMNHESIRSITELIIPDDLVLMDDTGESSLERHESITKENYLQYTGLENLLMDQITQGLNSNDREQRTAAMEQVINISNAGKILGRVAYSRGDRSNLITERQKKKYMVRAKQEDIKNAAKELPDNAYHTEAIELISISEAIYQKTIEEMTGETNGENIQDYRIAEVAPARTTLQPETENEQERKQNNIERLKLRNKVVETITATRKNILESSRNTQAFPNEKAYKVQELPKEVLLRAQELAQSADVSVVDYDIPTTLRAIYVQLSKDADIRDNINEIVAGMVASNAIVLSGKRAEGNDISCAQAILYLDSTIDQEIETKKMLEIEDTTGIDAIAPRTVTEKLNGRTHPNDLIREEESTLDIIAGYLGDMIGGIETLPGQTLYRDSKPENYTDMNPIKPKVREPETVGEDTSERPQETKDIDTRLAEASQKAQRSGVELPDNEIDLIQEQLISQE